MNNPNSSDLKVTLVSYLLLTSMVLCLMSTPDQYFLEEKGNNGIEISLEDADEEGKVHYSIPSTQKHHTHLSVSTILEHANREQSNHQNELRLFILYQQMKIDIC